VNIKKLGKALSVTTLISVIIAVVMAAVAYYLTREKEHIFELMLFLVIFIFVMKIRI
jgi:ABC-type spermidine/putrescine transport system permease subunit I